MPTQRTATIVLPTDGELIHAGGDRYRFLATRDDTAGRYGIWEAIVPPGGGPPPHLHTREEEGFYVIEGEVTIHVDGQQVTATAGSFVNMPVGSTHSFRNDSDRAAKLLILVAPGGLEAMFKQTGSPVVDTGASIPPISDDEKRRIGEIAPKFGVELKLLGDAH